MVTHQMGGCEGSTALFSSATFRPHIFLLLSPLLPNHLWPASYFLQATSGPLAWASPAYSPHGTKPSLGLTWPYVVTFSFSPSILSFSAPSYITCPLAATKQALDYRDRDKRKHRSSTRHKNSCGAKWGPFITVNWFKEVNAYADTADLPISSIIPNNTVALFPEMSFAVEMWLWRNNMSNLLMLQMDGSVSIVNYKWYKKKSGGIESCKCVSC